MKLWNALALAPLAFGCTQSVESTDVRTTGIYPEIEVIAFGDGKSIVQIQLKVGGESSNTFLELEGKDRLEVTADGDTKTPERSGNSYRTTFSTDEEGTEFEVAFLRGGDDDDAPSSVVTLPAPFDLTVDTTEASRADDDVDFLWDPPGTSGNMAWEIDGDCVKDADGKTPDDGAASLAAGEIETFSSDEEESCTVALKVTRSRNGSIDSAFTEGGSIVARHERTDSFTSTP
jgi:hypothetical protein